MSQNDKKGAGKTPTSNLEAGKSGSTQKGIKAKPVPKISNDK